MQLPEILLIDKPYGMTSFDVIRQLRRQTGIRKFGHAGTLDPLATGLMIVGVEKGTKKLSELIKLDKEYIAEIRLGERRATGDLEGEVLEEREVTEEISQSEISSVLQTFVGSQELPVSAYSAIKKDGKPMYKRARDAAKKGTVVEDLPIRIMEVYEAELLDVQSTTVNRSTRVVVTVRFFVGSGTYIRSLAEELGRRLGYPATLQNLQRTKIGEYLLSDALKLDAIK